MSIKERLLGASGTLSGIASILGSWQICHSICLGLIALLGLIGITLTGMPLFFFTTIRVPVWSIAVGLLGVTYVLYLKKRCVPRNLLIINTGLIIAGTPFYDTLSSLYYVIGGAVVIVGIGLIVKERYASFSKNTKKQQRCHV